MTIRSFESSPAALFVRSRRVSCQKHGDDARALGGGTTLVILMKQRALHYPLPCRSSNDSRPERNKKRSRRRAHRRARDPSHGRDLAADSRIVSRRSRRRSAKSAMCGSAEPLRWAAISPMPIIVSIRRRRCWCSALRSTSSVQKARARSRSRIFSAVCMKPRWSRARFSST